jgi:hypothetical protein
VGRSYYIQTALDNYFPSLSNTEKKTRRPKIEPTRRRGKTYILWKISLLFFVVEIFAAIFLCPIFSAKLFSGQKPSLPLQHNFMVPAQWYKYRCTSQLRSVLFGFSDSQNQIKVIKLDPRPSFTLFKL